MNSDNFSFNLPIDIVKSEEDEFGLITFEDVLLVNDKLMKNWFFKLTYKRQFIIHDKNWNITNYWKFVEDNKPNLKK